MTCGFLYPLSVPLCPFKSAQVEYSNNNNDSVYIFNNSIFDIREIHGAAVGYGQTPNSEFFRGGKNGFSSLLTHVNDIFERRL